jgi:hypothetical protein
MNEINLSQLLAQSGAFALIAGAFIKFIMGKVDKRIADNNDKFEEKLEKLFEKANDKRHKDKEQIFASINGIGEKVTLLEKELALQKQTDDRHDREFQELTRKHTSLDGEIKSIHEKVLLKIDELKDLILSRIVK